MEAKELHDLAVRVNGAIVDRKVAGYLRIDGGRRLSVVSDEWVPSIFAAYSPRNDNRFAEGPWEDWVTLARNILAVEEARAALSKATASQALGAPCLNCSPPCGLCPRDISSQASGGA